MLAFLLNTNLGFPPLQVTIHPPISSKGRSVETLRLAAQGAVAGGLPRARGLKVLLREDGRDEDSNGTQQEED